MVCQPIDVACLTHVIGNEVAAFVKVDGGGGTEDGGEDGEREEVGAHSDFV